MVGGNTSNFQGQKSLTYDFSTLDKAETKEEDVKSGQFKTKKCESIRNKFELHFSLVSNNIDVLLISETKIDNIFPVSQFCVPGY